MKASEHTVRKASIYSASKETFGVPRRELKCKSVSYLTEAYRRHEDRRAEAGIKRPQADLFHRPHVGFQSDARQGRDDQEL